MSKVTEIVKSLNALTVEELRTLNSEVVALLNHRHRMDQFEKARAFKPGDEVTFKTRQGKTITAIVNKINQKTVQVTQKDGGPFPMSWNVSPGLLTKVAA